MDQLDSSLPTERVSSTIAQPPNFRLLFESSPGLYLVLTPDFTIVAVSDAYSRATMTNRDDVLGRSIFEVFPDNPADPAATGVRNLRESLERVVRHRVADAMAVQKYDVRRPDSLGGEFEERHWSPINSPVLGAENELLYIIHQVEDVTEFVRLKERESEQEKLNELLRTQSGQMEAEIFRRAQEIHEANRQLRKVQAELELHVQERTAELTKTIGQLRQESDARQEAEASVHRLAALVASSEDAIIGLDLNAIITDWNSGAEKLFGYLAAEVIGRNVMFLVPEADRSRAEWALKQRSPVSPYEAIRDRKDGSRVTVSVCLSPIYQQGRMVGFSLIYRDITYTKRLEDQFRHAQKMEAIGTLAGGVAHDFNNLLTIISGYSELLLDQLTPSDPAHSLIEQIRKAGERAAALTRQLLAFSRQQVMELKVLDLNAIVGDTEKMLRRLIGEDISLATALNPRLGTIKADAGQIEQIIMNLSVNARDAMPRGGKLTIETDNVSLDQSYAQSHMEVQPGRYVMLAVSDTGCGMNEATKARIFEPFFTTKEKGKGTGLGLATVFGIVKQTGGHIWVYSELGQGTTFKIYFPMTDGTVPTGNSFDGKAVPTGIETILYVEDEDAVRALTVFALRSFGYTVLEANRGQEAIRLCETYQGPIHLLLSDVVMPEMGGRQVADAILSLRPNIKVLFVSGYTDDAIVRHGILHEQVAFLQKPFTPNALARKVRDVLSR